MDNNELSRSWFCVLNNPENIYDGEPNEIAEKCLADWICDKPTRTGAVAYCISKDGLKHLHMVLEDSNKSRFSAIKRAYPKAHIEPTRGTKEQAEDYINKRGKFEEKGEQIIYIAKYGEIKGCQGARKDIEVIEDMINSGMNPNEIMRQNLGYRRYANMIKDAFFDKRHSETPFTRDVVVYWHVGASGTGKSYVAVQLREKYGENEVYFCTDCSFGGFDKYCAEKVLFIDEFRGQIPYHTLLNYLDKYVAQIHARYVNLYALWNEVHISSVLPPEKVYEKMVSDSSDRYLDTIRQLLRRITYITYHYIDENNNYNSYTIPGEKYIDYNTLIQDAHGGYIPCDNPPFSKTP